MRILVLLNRLGDYMTGWNIKQGYYSRETITETDLWKIFNKIISAKSQKTSSYKFGFLKALLENSFISNDKGETDFYEIFFNFTSTYWTLIVVNDLKQICGSRKTAIEVTIDKYILKNPQIRNSYFDNLPKNLQEAIVKEIIGKCKDYVIGAIYKDSEYLFYDFDISNKFIRLNPEVISFFNKYHEILLKLNNYSWAQFLEKTNEEDKCNLLLSKIDTSSKRSNLKKYKDLLYNDLGYNSCFYHDGIVSYDKVSVDHFIPWSFIRNDKIWNLVISCKNCNEILKKTKIPSNKFIDKLKKRNCEINCYNNKLIEADFISYKEKKLDIIIESAIFNGYEYGWEPNFILQRE